MIKIWVDADKKKRIVDSMTFDLIYEHFQWCMRNCNDYWYNECEDYSYICFFSATDAHNFAKVFAPFDSEQQEMWFMLKFL